MDFVEDLQQLFDLLFEVEIVRPGPSAHKIDDVHPRARAVDPLENAGRVLFGDLEHGHHRNLVPAELIAQRLSAPHVLVRRSVPQHPRHHRARRVQVAHGNDVRTGRGLLREVQELLTGQVESDPPPRPLTVHRTHEARQPLLSIDDVLHRSTGHLRNSGQSSNLVTAGQPSVGRTPHQQTANGIVPADRVQQIEHLFRLPDERPLILRQNDLSGQHAVRERRDRRNRRFGCCDAPGALR
jgi:hypothetical protein